MISVEEALAYVLKHFQPLEPERVPLLEALDRVLTQDVVADINVPPFNNSAMDGYAVIADDIADASREHPVTLRVIGEVAAGYTASRAVERGTAMRIMTGAPLPTGADTVVRFEETSEGRESGAKETRKDTKERESVDILKAISRGDNVRAAGEDIRVGEVVFPKGTTVRPGEIGVMASLGKKYVAVHRRPRVAILATGDELVAIDAPITPGKNSKATGYDLQAKHR